MAKMHWKQQLLSRVKSMQICGFYWTSKS